MSARILSAAVATASMPGEKHPFAFPLPSIETPCRQIRSPRPGLSHSNCLGFGAKFKAGRIRRSEVFRQRYRA
ncbi:hypothetical protein [Novosphingobium sp.]|jgi:hypothetical protein|uniref:hypothetical protein n=1 Tax=Novosphingobium sp. TaxID=1874826 RepID=UPI002FE0C5C4